VPDGSGDGLVIGDYCFISAGVQTYTHDTVEWTTSGGKAIPAQAPGRIRSRCHIGPNVIIYRYVTIVDACVIEVNIVVNSDLTAGSITRLGVLQQD
jgi:acetyltransferase-like isoleucine patch superfamily enzyme